MVEITGESLSKRQQELNAKVKEAVEKQIDLSEIKALEEKTDLDKLFKIDVASHYKNVDYIVEILKCGDSLYISRALKCVWLYSDDYAHIINMDFLHHEIFPHMSLFMKNKMINTIASHVKNEERAIAFYEYFLNLKMNKFALKFLLITSEPFKLKVLEENILLLTDYCEYLKHFVGNSFVLAEAYISKIAAEYRKDIILRELSYLYTIDEEKYLNLFEKNFCNSSKSFGGRMSKSIMTKHKSRVIGKPCVYVRKITKYMLARHSTADDAKKYISALFPATLKEFWRNDFYHNFKYIFDIIPQTEVFAFFKNTFHSAFGNAPFEMDVQFYHFKYYKLLTVEEREKWALKHIQEGRELLGSDNDYIWYTFVNFDEAFKAIKLYILKTTDEDKRNKMVRVLINSARDQRELETLCDYFNERFVNEAGHHKEDFVNEVTSLKNVFEFDEACWTAFNKILYSMEVYTAGFYGRDQHRAMCIIYNIIHDKEMAEALTFYIDSGIGFWELKQHSKSISNEEWETVYQYLHDYYFMKFKSVNIKDIDAMKEEKVNIATKLIDILTNFGKTKADVPPLMMSFIEENIKDFEHFKIFRSKEKLTETTLLRLLKVDKNLVINKLPDVKETMTDSDFRLTHLLRKIKIYFSNDMAKEFEQFFIDCIKATSSKSYRETNVIKSSVYGIFQVADEAFKKEMLIKYKPIEGRIDHSTIDRELLTMQEQICRLACYARPPVPLEHILQYIKLDYIHFCFPMINMFLAKLPLPLSNKLIEFLLNNPVSIQKHGIRLAFQLYSMEDLKKLISNIWQKSKNVSLRVVIYKALVNKIKEVAESAQDGFAQSLITLTSSLNEDDQDDIFDLLSSYEIPSKFRGSLYEAAWGSLKNLSHLKSRNLKIKIKIITSIMNQIEFMNRDYCRTEIIDAHIHKMFNENGIQQTYNNKEDEFNSSLWCLTAKYIVTCNNQAELVQSLELLEIILHQILFQHWSLVVDKKYIIVELFYTFINHLKSDSYCDCKDEYIITIFEKILSTIQGFSPNYEMFAQILDTKLFIMMRKIKNENISDIEKVAKAAHTSLMMFIQDLKINNQLHPCFFNKICTLMTNNVDVLATLMRMNGDILISYICHEIVSSEDIEAIVFAISMMPVRSSEEPVYKELSSEFIRKVKNVNNFVVQSYYYSKFVLNNYQIIYD